MGLFKDNKNESRQFFESDIQPDILEEKKEMLSESEQLGSDIDRVINERSNDIEHMDILDDDSVEETAVITAGLTVTGNLDSTGSIDIYGTVEGDVSCMGKLTVSGVVRGAIGANEVFANDAQIEGDIHATGSVKIGKGTVIIGDLYGTSAVIAGAVKGNIDIEGPVIVDSTAIVVGDMKFKTVQINNGATIEGRCQYRGSVPEESFCKGRTKSRTGRGGRRNGYAVKARRHLTAEADLPEQIYIKNSIPAVMKK